jgi:pantoate kinase
MEASAFAPAHITGLVAPYEKPDDPLHSGSKGIGFSIQEGVITKVKAERGTGQAEIEINGKSETEAKVSRETVKTILDRADDRRYRLTVEHLVQVPIGVGFGTSGAAALSLAFAVNEACKLGFSKVEAAQAAHVAEVTCRTGLGTVLAELHGGFEVRVSPGAPGIGQLVKIPLNKEYSVITLTFGALSTDKMLDSLERRREAYAMAESLLTSFSQDCSVEAFLHSSNQFARRLALNSRLQRVLDEAEDAGFICGVALFGETVFTLVKPEETTEVERIFKHLMTNSSKILTTRISDKGARVL